MTNIKMAIRDLFGVNQIAREFQDLYQNWGLACGEMERYLDKQKGIIKILALGKFIAATPDEIILELDEAFIVLLARENAVVLHAGKITYLDHRNGISVLPQSEWWRLYTDNAVRPMRIETFGLDSLVRAQPGIGICLLPRDDMPKS